MKTRRRRIFFFLDLNGTERMQGQKYMKRCHIKPNFRSFFHFQDFSWFTIIQFVCSSSRSCTTFHHKLLSSSGTSTTADSHNEEVTSAPFVRTLNLSVSLTLYKKVTFGLFHVIVKDVTIEKKIMNNFDVSCLRLVTAGRGCSRPPQP